MKADRVVINGSVHQVERLHVEGDRVPPGARIESRRLPAGLVHVNAEEGVQPYILEIRYISQTYPPTVVILGAISALIWLLVGVIPLFWLVQFARPYSLIAIAAINLYRIGLLPFNDEPDNVRFGGFYFLMVMSIAVDIFVGFLAAQWQFTASFFSSVSLLVRFVWVSAEYIRYTVVSAHDNVRSLSHPHLALWATT
jgi:hypothetical protein